jgi:hypothetical protein
MLSVTELRRVAASMEPEAFERQLGPFVLVQRPPDEMTQQRALMLGAKRTIAHQHATNAQSLLFDFDDLLIATLPPMSPVDVMKVGRLPDCELVVDDPSVSKLHARLTWQAGANQVTVEDAGSSNGTFLNGVPVVGARTINDGDDVAFGDARFCFLRSRTLHQRLTTGRFKKR